MEWTSLQLDTGPLDSAATRAHYVGVWTLAAGRQRVVLV